MPYKGDKAARQRDFRKAWKSKGLCTDCRKPNPTEFYRCPNCRLIHNQGTHARSHQRIQDGLCRQCGKNSIDSSRSKNRCFKCLDREKKSHFAYRDKRNAKSRNYQQRLKDEVLAAYGGPICNCCGETNKMLLTIDHLENNGMEHRRAIKTLYIYPWLKKHKFPPGYQVLCFSCNHGRHLNGGSLCPAHEEHAKIKLHRARVPLADGQMLVEVLLEATDKLTTYTPPASA